MTAFGPKWAIRRYQPAAYSRMELEGLIPLSPAHDEQVYDDWADVVKAVGTIIGANALQTGVVPQHPVVIKHGDDVVLIYMKLVMG